MLLEAVAYGQQVDSSMCGAHWCVTFVPYVRSPSPIVPNRAANSAKSVQWQISGCVATRQGGGLMLDNSGDSSGLTLGALYNSTVQNCSAPYSGGGLLATDLLDISPSPGNLSPV